MVYGCNIIETKRVNAKIIIDEGLFTVSLITPENN